MLDVPLAEGSVLIEDQVPMGRIDTLEKGEFELVGDGVCVVCWSREQSPPETNKSSQHCGGLT